MLKTDYLLINISLSKRAMKTILLICVLVALGTCAVGPTGAALLACTVQTSIWEIYNYPVSGNTVQFQFQRRADCKHYFKISSSCTRYEATYTTIHDLAGSPAYTIDAVSLPWVNLVGCSSTMTATLEGNIVNAFNPPPKGGWYHIFLTVPAQVNWGGYVASWLSGPQKVWFS